MTSSTSFYMFWPLVCLLWKMSIQVLCPFVNGVLWLLLLFAIEFYEFVSYVINLLSDIWKIWKYFWSFIHCLFFLLFPLSCKSALVWCSHNILFLLLLSLFLVSFQKVIAKANVKEPFLCSGGLWFQVLLLYPYTICN